MKFNLNSEEIIQLKQKDVKSLREQILKKQNNKCAVTGKEIEKPCLDHEHKKKLKGSGKVRGVVNASINIFLGKLENNCKRYGIELKDLPDTLRQIADYLEKDQYPFIHPSEKEKEKILKKSSYNQLLKELKKINFKNKIPEYKERKNKKIQKLTKPLEKLFNKVNLKPEFY